MSLKPGKEGENGAEEIRREGEPEDLPPLVRVGSPQIEKLSKYRGGKKPILTAIKFKLMSLWDKDGIFNPKRDKKTL